MKMSKNVTRMKIVVVPGMVMIPIQMLIWDYKRKGGSPFLIVKNIRSLICLALIKAISLMVILRFVYRFFYSLGFTREASCHQVGFHLMAYMI